MWRFCRVVLLLGINGIILSEVGGADPDPDRCASMPVRQERFLFLKESLEWMTFRRAGALVPSDELRSPLLTNLLETYLYSGNFRSLVVAFMDGVAPKLTLKAGQKCDPNSISKYRNPYTNRFGWHETKNFIFSTYENRNTDTTQFCDFRLGLVCNPNAQPDPVCECRPGAEMKPISPNSNIQRCLLAEKVACAVPDLNYLNPRSLSLYADNWLRHMIFNPERAEGCQMGKQCRLIEADPDVGRCYDSTTNSNNWESVWNDIPIGSACSIDFPPQSFITKCEDLFRWHPGDGFRDLQCYNFGPSGSGGVISSPTDALQREGFCADFGGSYQIRKFYFDDYSDYDKKLYRIWPGNFIMGFVSRRTTSFTDKQLKEYYEKYIDEVYPKIFGEDEKDPTGERNPNLFLSSRAWQPCNVDKTEKMKTIWKFYADLEGSPTPAGAKELEDNLNAMIELVDKTKDEGKFCKVFWSYDLDGKVAKPLECDKGSTSSGNNDGRCKAFTPQDSAKGKAFAEKLYNLQEYLVKADGDMRKEDEEYNPRLKIWENDKDPGTCTEYEIGHPCPDDKYVCFRDYRDRDSKYTYQTCELYYTPELTCMEMDSPPNPHNSNKCEGIYMKRLLKEVVDRMVGTLGRGETCNPTHEKELRKLIKDQGEDNQEDKYKLIARLKRRGYCDRTRLLTCDMVSRKCVCYPGTKPRNVLIDGQLYESDYCYAKSGSCSHLDPVLNPTLELLNTAEKEGIKKHYGTPNGNCDWGNFCLFVDAKRKQCTEENTGNTGYGPTSSTGGGGDGGTGGGDGDGGTGGGGGTGGLGVVGGVAGGSGKGSGSGGATTKMGSIVATKILAFLSLFGNSILKYF